VRHPDPSTLGTTRQEIRQQAVALALAFVLDALQGHL
jgi:hypothetical protein